MYKITSALSLDPKLLKEDVVYLLGILDEKVPEIVEDIYLNIYDKNSAIKFKTFYDKDWFKDLKISTDSKIRLAQILKNRFEKFEVNSLIWDGIVNMEPEIIKDIDILENKGK